MDGRGCGAAIIQVSAGCGGAGGGYTWGSPSGAGLEGTVDGKDNGKQGRRLHFWTQLK